MKQARETPVEPPPAFRMRSSAGQPTKQTGLLASPDFPREEPLHIASGDLPYWGTREN